MFNYNKVIVIGCSGSGKTTFSTKLTEIIHIPLYYLDRIYWNADCSHITRQAFIEKQKEILTKDKWIVDGNFRSTLEMRIKAAEMIFLFDIPVEDCISGAVNRVKNKEKRPDLPCELPADDELVTLIKCFNTDVRPMIFDYLNTYSDKKVVIFTSREQADDYLKNLSKELIAERSKNNGYDH
ncbi:MAG: adenylate kinase [Clostridium sp.]|nr:adenylate kinase [Clostridium sp.]